MTYGHIELKIPKFRLKMMKMSIKNTNDLLNEIGLKTTSSTHCNQLAFHLFQHDLLLDSTLLNSAITFMFHDIKLTCNRESVISLTLKQNQMTDLRPPIMDDSPDI